MTASLKPYPAYKPSGVEWLGDVPKHWKVRRLKYTVTLNPSRTESCNSLIPDTTVTFLPMERVGVDGRIDPQEPVPASKVWNGFTYFRRGDVLVAKITPCFENGKGAHLHSLPTEVGFGSTEFHVLRARSVILPDFLYYFTTTFEFRRLGTDAMTGSAGQQRVPANFIANCPIPLPPLSEQHRIATFLDQKTAEIDEAINKKQRLIELLKEQKAILINQAVTKGLNPNVPMRDSGVEWIGEVPAHWEVKRLKHLFAEVDERSIDGKEILLSLRMYEGLVPHTQVSDKIISATDLIGYRRVYPGQLVMNRMRASIGLFGVARHEGLVSPDYVTFDTSAASDEDYYLHLFKTSALGRVFRLESKGIGTGSSGFLRLYSDRFGMIKVPVPPKSDQKKIVLHIEAITKESEYVVEKMDKEITLLNELKNVVISNAVTGKIKI